MEKKKVRNSNKVYEKKNIIASFTSYSIIDSFGKVVGFREAQKKITFKDLKYSCDIGLSTVVLRKIKKINNIIKFPNIKTKEDYVLWINLSKNKVNFLA